MAALEEGFQYGLSSNPLSASNKTVVHVKLTDTSLKIIEDYLKRKSILRAKPVIQFQDNHGTIQLPEANDELRTFQFTLSALQGDPNGSFDAVCQRNSRSGQHLSVEGSMTNKIQIHATNELFQATKDRVTQAELDVKKVSTKVIKQSGPHISRKKTTVIRNSHAHVSQPPPRPQQLVPPPSKPKPPTALPVNFSKRPSPSYGSQGHSAVSPHNPTVNSFSASSSSSSSVSTTKPASPSLSSSSSSPANRPSGNAAVMSMPYRDRIIHLLAIRSYKKPELIIRLRKDGIREKDRDSLGTILNQVATSKDNTFTLAKHAYSDVRLDWPFYSDEDRYILKKKLQSASSVSPAASPANRSPDSQSATVLVKSEPQKRPAEDSHSQHNAAKKKRISLYERKEKGSSRSSDHRSASSDRSNVSSTVDSSDKKENISDTVDSTSDTPEYVGYYCISSDDQRQRYKQEFNQEYEEYKLLHVNVDKVVKKFHDLQVLRRKTPRDTIEYEDLEDRIRKEYVQQKSDPKYLEQKKRFDYLHGKLAYIKKLILEFDHKHSPSTS